MCWNNDTISCILEMNSNIMLLHLLLPKNVNLSNTSRPNRTSKHASSQRSISQRLRKQNLLIFDLAGRDAFGRSNKFYSLITPWCQRCTLMMLLWEQKSEGFRRLSDFLGWQEHNDYACYLERLTKLDVN